MLKITKTTEKTKPQNYSSPGINHLLKPVKVAVYDEGGVAWIIYLKNRLSQIHLSRQA